MCRVSSPPPAGSRYGQPRPPPVACCRWDGTPAPVPSICCGGRPIWRAGSPAGPTRPSPRRRPTGSPKGPRPRWPSGGCAGLGRTRRSGGPRRGRARWSSGGRPHTAPPSLRRLLHRAAAGRGSSRGLHRSRAHPDHPRVARPVRLPRMRIAELRLVGPGGEPVDLWRTINSHGITELPPLSLDETARTLQATLRLPGGGARTVTVGESRPGHVGIDVARRRPAAAAVESLREAVIHILRLDEDLSPFYALAEGDPELEWVRRGAGRMARSATVFEEVVKTICTTNCSWSATRRMVSALVDHLGEKAPGAPPSGAGGRCFPTPAAMASAGACHLPI